MIATAFANDLIGTEIDQYLTQLPIEVVVARWKIHIQRFGQFRS